MKVTVLFSTRDRANVLRRTLDAMARLEPPEGGFEIIVGDNGSGDDTAAVLNSAAGRVPLRSFTESVPGKNRVLNRAVDMSRGELLVFTDDDVLPDPGWLKAYVVAAEAFPDDAVFGGAIMPDFPTSAPGWVRELSPLVQKFAFSRFDPGVPAGPMRNSPTGPNMMIRRKVFETFQYNESIGPAGKNYAMGSETELLSRLHDAGYRFIFVPKAPVRHIVREEQTTLAWLAGRAHRLGRGQMAQTQLRGGVGKLVARSLFQAAVSFPSFAFMRFAEDRRRFWGVWHWRKSCGRLAQLRA